MVEPQTQMSRVDDHFVNARVGVVVFWLVGLGRTTLQTAAKTDEFEARLTGVYEAALTQLAQFGLPLETTSIKSHLQSLPIGKAFGSIRRIYSMCFPIHFSLFSS